MNSKLFSQFKNNNRDKKYKKEESLSKEKNLTSSRKKVNNSYKKSITENNHTLNNINNFNYIANTNKKRKIIFNAKKINKEIYNLKKNILDKKFVISKKEIGNIINNTSNINSKKGNNLSINSAKSESEERKKYEDKYNNRLSYELILPKGNEYQVQNNSTRQKKLKINRNIMSPINGEKISMTYNSTFSINNQNNDIIKVNLNENKKEKKSIKKEPINFKIYSAIKIPLKT